MELIYANHDLTDIGIIDFAELDYDSATDKDFEIKVDSSKADMSDGMIWYVINEEYGGIIKDYTINTDDDTVTYTGPNFRGLLDNKILNSENAILYYSGNFQDICNEILEDKGLDDFFVCDETEIEIEDGQIASFSTVYNGLFKLLDDMNAVLILTFKPDKKVHITAELNADYSDEIQYSGDNSYGFEFNKVTSSPNHYIMHGSDDNGKIHQIHLFVDENGGLQPYANTDNPLQDSDYILDESQKVITGIDEVERESEESISAETNYKILTKRPSDWSRNYANYFTYSNDGESDSYNAVEPESTYTVLSSKPSDWNKHFDSYYIHNSSGTDDYSAVSSDSENNYSLLKKKPSDWKKNYGLYYGKSNDGTMVSYNAVSGENYNKYVKQTMKPSDWSSKYASYYRIKKGKYVKVSGKKAPTWKQNKYYTQTSKEKAPTFTANKYYYVSSTTATVPTWESGKYFSKTDAAPAFSSNEYYEAVVDHYASMVESAKTKFEEEKNSESMSYTLSDYDVRIGDVVGGTDDTTGEFVTQKVTNIIFGINSNGIESYEYEVGGNK